MKNKLFYVVDPINGYDKIWMGIDNWFNQVWIYMTEWETSIPISHQLEHKGQRELF